MAENKPQSFTTHARYDPLFHFFALPELTEGQLIALRFASDAEVAGLTERALAEGLSKKDIKKAIQVWRPDYWRV